MGGVLVDAAGGAGDGAPDPGSAAAVGERRRGWVARAGAPARGRSAPAAGPAAGPESAVRDVFAAGGGQGRPFRRAGLLNRILPFALLAVLAEASLGLPPGPDSMLETALSAALLAAAGAAVFLPWDRLPSWSAVLVPLLYTSSVLMLILASGGTNSGVSAVLLIPLTWTALFHRPWESATVIAAMLLVLFVVSEIPDQASGAVIARRLFFWGALATMIAVAAHGLRARISRSQAATARLQGRLRELSILRDRDRIASNLQDTVVQRLFAAGLSLQGLSMLAPGPEASHRIEAVVHNLDEAIRLLRQSIFGLEHGLPEQGLRRSILDVTGELTPVLGVVPEVTLDGPIDTAIPPAVAGPMLTALREALSHSGAPARATRVAVAVVAEPDEVVLTVTDNGGRWSARAAADAPMLERMRERARRLGGTLEASAADAGARLTWRAPLPPGGGSSLRRYLDGASWYR